MQITRIQQAQNNDNRVNLFIDGEFWIGIGKDELIYFQLFKGKEIDSELKSEIEGSACLTKIVNKTISYIQIRPRSEKEVRDYLKRKDIDSEASNEILSKLKSRNLISDEFFAKWYIENRLISGKYGEIRIKNELRKKGISKDIIEESFNNLMTADKQNEVNENAINYAKKVSKSIKSKNDYEFKTKLIKKLMSRGYSYSMSSKIANELKNWSIQ
jgi:regulatory protein